jgi:hypothetical protein
VIEEVVTFNSIKYAKMHPANQLEIAQALRTLFYGQAKRESLIQRGKGGACRFTGCGFLTALCVLLDGFQAIRRCRPAGPQFPSA